jgi:hypothetical protein
VTLEAVAYNSALIAFSFVCLGIAVIVVRIVLEVLHR